MNTYKIATEISFHNLDNCWSVHFVECDEFQQESMRSGFKTEAEATGFMNGWNNSRRAIADALLKNTLNHGGNI